ncbi:hypothetical protein IC617_08905 [Neiella sp. HB171785]|uniref:DUF3267 domain-containing protein n=1 Tax=Neiella litorisoli TaxID=2771431 RepID=A0A8J6QJY8_9GAMM|nr:hypothetical protein [Neiella litorisoli]MBD1389546.1 hypothetical protein [Neiella litorisoli]
MDEGLVSWGLTVLGYIGAIVVLLQMLQVATLSLIRVLVKYMGRPAYLFIASIGVPLHELAHAIACVVFGHKIHRIVWFSPSPSQYASGFVEHSWNRRPWPMIGNFFIGIAPLIAGIALIYCAASMCLPRVDLVNAAVTGMLESRSLEQYLADIGKLYQSVATNFHIDSMSTVSTIVGVCAIGMFMVPSRADLKHCPSGLLMVALAIGALALMGGDWAARVNGFLLLGLSWLLASVIGVLSIVGGAAFVVVLGDKLFASVGPHVFRKLRLRYSKTA